MQMQSNDQQTNGSQRKKSNDFLIIKNITKHVLEENKHTETKISKQQKTDKNTHAQQRDKTRTFNYRKPKITKQNQHSLKQKSSQFQNIDQKTPTTINQRC